MRKVPALEWGMRTMLERHVSELLKINKVYLMSPGLHLHAATPYLGAYPDGLYLVLVVEVFSRSSPLQARKSGSYSSV